jgi:hypothetical protein
MHVDIGIRYYGKTDAVDNEAVFTAFFVVAVPLFPVGCWYGVRTGNWFDAIAGRRIRWHPKSVLLAYLRWVLAAVPVVAFIQASPQPGRRHWDPWWLVIASVLTAFYLAVLFLLTKAPSERARQRQLLARAVGSTADPRWLYSEDCLATLAKLQPALDALGILPEPRRWQLRTPEPELAPFVYAMACYRAPLEPDADWEAVAERVWTLIDASRARGAGVKDASGVSTDLRG